ncbi:BstXI family restriction endonuclease [Streptomyces marincola]|uniref:Restriction endonuclease n=1 Tax=Streptomyces marincola TaxID=2878388 RepID=A0A1W7CVQ6_9ACTN|nr:BstXI family restriction endonuclease [Streptomyces marincola]ARQ68835.1 hypothetical protein CAG99_08135 [Streptomyces marincola]
MSAARSKRLPKLPDLINRKLYKTGQTRGATQGEIYQNRVGRSSTVLIPHRHFEACRVPDDGTTAYEKGFIVLVSPSWYFEEQRADERLADQGLRLGENALLFFQQPWEWRKYADERGMAIDDERPLVPAIARLAPLGGNYIARVPGTTAASGFGRIDRGFTTTDMRGAGVRVYEYASEKNITRARVQLEALIWMCRNAVDGMVKCGMKQDAAQLRRDKIVEQAEADDLLDLDRLRGLRMVNPAGYTVCPLCLKEMTVAEFATRSAQAEGRETWDNTVTEASLFHIQELRIGRLQHKPYNLGWGHHHCNVVVKDYGIFKTLEWMRSVLEANREQHPEEL